MDDEQSLYDELYHIAKIHRRKWTGNETLNTTALIHEAWLKMNPSNAQYRDKTHFYATAARVMRQVLINYAERSKAQKRVSPESQAEYSLYHFGGNTSLIDVLYVDELLKQIEQENPRACQILECRIFGGLTVQEISKVLKISVSTVKREWSFLSAWLYNELLAHNADKCEALKQA